MYSMPFTIKTLSPVIVPRISGDQVLTETENYFPGSVIRGILAGCYIQQRGLTNDAHQNEDFYRYFLSGELRYLPAYPAIKHNEKLLSAQPVPRCLQQDKKETKIIELCKSEEKGKTISDFAVLENEDDKIVMYKVSPVKRIAFHVVRGQKSEDRLAGASMEEGIFNYEAIEEGQYFVGSILGDENDLSALQQVVGKQLYITVGRSKRVQYGKCILTFSDIYPIDVAEIIEEYEDGNEDICLACHTPLLLEQDYRRQAVQSVSESVAAMLNERTGVSLSVTDVFAATKELEQFVGVWGMKRSRVQTVAPGSFFVIKPMENNCCWDKETLERILHAIYCGVGRRTVEGFGQMRILAHATDGYVIGNIVPDNINIEKPVGSMPVMLQQLLKDIVKNKLLDNIRAEAVLAAEQYMSDAHSAEVGTTLAGKLESTLNEAKNAEQFINLINGYCDTAKRKLCSLHKDSGGSLLSLLTADKYPYGRNKILCLGGSVRAVVNTIGWYPKDDTAFQEQLYREYWLSFFRHMRKTVQLREAAAREQ